MNILLDCGSNVGQGYEILSKKLNVDSNWDVYMFEPNKKCVDILNNKYNNFNIFNKAVWTVNEKRKLTLEYCPYFNDWIGGATHIIETDNYIKPVYIKDEYLKAGDYVDCIDFSEFLSFTFNKNDKIILKFDIEGAEFDVLDKMINDKTIFLISTIYVEWHNHLIKNKKNENYYINFFNENNIIYNKWF